MTCQVTDVDTSSNLKTISGRAVPYSAWADRGWFLLSMAQGCFDKSIKEAATALPLMLFHDYESFPIAKASKWRSDADGLWGEWDLDEDPRAQRAAQQARDGYLTGLSVGWEPILNEWEVSDPEEWSLDDRTTLDRCTLKEGRLVEVSLTPVPNFVDATVAMVAHRREPQRRSLDEWKAWRDSLTG